MAESRPPRARLDTPRTSRRQLVRRPSYDPDLVGTFAENFARFMGTATFLAYMTAFVAVQNLLNRVNELTHTDDGIYSVTGPRQVNAGLSLKF